MHWEMFSSMPASTHYKPIAGENRHTQNIKINTFIGENENCLLFYWKQLNWLFCQSNTLLIGELFALFLNNDLFVLYTVLKGWFYFSSVAHKAEGPQWEGLLTEQGMEAQQQGKVTNH